MKSLFRFSILYCFIFCGISCYGCGSARAEIIQSFHAEIRAQSDTSFDVLETIDMDFQSAQKHGIYRIIPVVYDRSGGKYTIYLDVLDVTDEKDQPYSYTTSRQGRDLMVKIGDADTTVSGLHVYKLHYKVRRAVNFFGGAPEIYWNATGNEWPFAMKIASARLYPPPGVKVSSLKTASFFGPLGSMKPAHVKVEADSVLFYTENLQPSDGLTFVAGFPAGSMQPPSALQTFLWFFADWWPLFTFPIVAASIISMVWSKTGRDVEGNLPAQVEWAPPKDLSPAEVGTLIDESCDMTDIVSTLIDLAARGYLTIQELQTEKLLFFQSRDYAFIRTPRAHNLDEKLLPHESLFLRGVFGSEAAPNDRVLLSSLKEQFYVHLPAIRDSIYDLLTQKRLFTANPATTRSTYQGIGGAVFGAGVLAAFFLPLAYGIGLALAGIVVFLSARAMPAKTATGSRKLRECQGFQRFVKLAEKDRIEKLITDDPTIFGRLLPYAMVLGVGDEWAGKFAGLMTEPPDWYSGNSGNFSTYYFVNSLGSGMNSMGQTFQSKPAPQSTGGSGGSGFSGGGSGGGFGGGGGGSW
ncbi:DUF2207 domain-containing protein [Abditibacterium utsteinense]|uniref:DUF2207 domain-containing protein n=1 Tax=Abditibacterium utsteinense TaxID=1960156 RepID=UPI00130033E6|nr:DUF2207 domain-containing protein [Abditibacterium utsteinense]